MTPGDRTRTSCKSARCQLFAMFTLRRHGGISTDAQNPCYINLARYLSENIAVIVLIFTTIKTLLVALFQSETHRYANPENKQHLVSITTKGIFFIVTII